MGLSYYGFALFIFGLLCAFAFLCKNLFMCNKGHILSIDKKERKLLTLYRAMEDMLNEFNQTALVATTEMKRYIAEMHTSTADILQMPTPLGVKPAATPPLPASHTAIRHVALAGVLHNAAAATAEAQMQPRP